jgi:RNA polymerase sigma-70 factor (ECF subfamily)
MDTVLTWSFMARADEETATGSLDADAQLMLRFKAGDAEAFESLFFKHMRPIVSFAYRFVHNRETAEELAQEIFLKVYQGARAYRPQAKFTTWLYRIATNLCLNEIRKPDFRAAHRSLALSSSESQDSTIKAMETGGPDEILGRDAILHALKQALDQIPERQRTAFILNKYQDLSYAEVAEIMRMSEKAVKSLIHRAKETLAQKLKPLLPELLHK